MGNDYPTLPRYGTDFIATASRDGQPVTENIKSI
jgi:hypothetical protein